MENEQQKIKKLEGFGGWLLFFGFVNFLAPIFFILDLLSKPELLGLNLRTTIAVITIMLEIGILYLMIKRKKSFKIWYVTINIICILAAVLGILVISNMNILNQKQILSLYLNSISKIIPIIIWSLYLWNSKRVQNTFIN